MTMTTKPLVVLDIGSTKIACAVGRPTEAAPSTLPRKCRSTPGLRPTEQAACEVLGTGVASYPTLKSTWPCDQALLARTIEEALEEAHLDTWPDRAIVILTHPALSHRVVTAQLNLADEPVTIRGRDLDRLHAQAVSQALEVDREPLLLDPLGYAGNGFDAAGDPRGLVATRVQGRFQLIGIPMAVKRAVLQALDVVGLELDRVVYSLQAVVAACMEESWWSKRVLLVDFGGCCTDLALWDNGHLVRSTSIPWGGMTIVEAIATDARMTMDHALTASLEGLSSPHPVVRKVFNEQLRLVESSLRHLLEETAHPDRAIVTGRGALIGGLVEWVEQISRTKAVLGRSPLAKGLGDLGRQMALSPSLGLLQRVCQTAAASSHGAPSRVGIQGSGRLIDRLLARTRHILVEYF